MTTLVMLATETGAPPSWVGVLIAIAVAVGGAGTVLVAIARWSKSVEQKQPTKSTPAPSIDFAAYVRDRFDSLDAKVDTNHGTVMELLTDTRDRVVRLETIDEVTGRHSPLRKP